MGNKLTIVQYSTMYEFGEVSKTLKKLYVYGLGQDDKVLNQVAGEADRCLDCKNKMDLSYKKFKHMDHRPFFDKGPEAYNFTFLQYLFSNFIQDLPPTPKPRSKSR